ncbi:MAG TPA: zinc-binding alcohol dehydrogenase [Anaerolineales bacterium]
MKARTVYFTAPKKVEVREHELPPLKDDEVLVKTICSSISAGTETLVYRGQFPQVMDSHDALSSNLKYPLAYGYACVGRITETGKQIDKGLRDRLVFGFHPHASSFITKISLLILIPASLSADTCSFFPNMETAVNLIHDAAPILGERVLVLGQGVVGLLVASLLKEFPLECLVTSDYYAIRRKASLDLGVNAAFDPVNDISSTFSGNKKALKQELKYQSDYAQKTELPMNFLAYAQIFDLTFELSGSPSALNDAIAMTAFSGRIVVGSWYGEKQAQIDFGSSFHRSRIQLISSQVSTIAPALSGRWDKARRFEVAWEALKRIQPQKWITHRFSIEEASEAYSLLDENPQETIQVIFEYS